MKLEKREITLNEADSLRDLLYFERSLCNAYGAGAQSAERKETERELLQFQQETQENEKRIEELLKQSLQSVGISLKKKVFTKE